MNVRQRRRYLRRFFEKNDWLYQFGQPLQTCNTTRFGASGCTHTNLQALHLLWNGKEIEQDEISSLCGYKSTDRGMTSTHVELALKKLKLPYKMVFDEKPWNLVRTAAQRGPVLVATRYLLHPEMQGAIYYGHRADGQANGFARPLGEAGKNQLTGFTGGHSELLLSARRRSDGIVDTLVHDPNHNSSARPKKVPYDIMTFHQFREMFTGYAVINRAKRTVAAIPLEVFNG